MQQHLTLLLLSLLCCLAAGIPSPAISELIGGAVPGLDLDAMTALPSKKKKGGKKKEFAPVVDEVTELTDLQLRGMLQNTSDITIQRPVMPPPFRSERSFDDALQRPFFADPETHPTMPQRMADMMADLCRSKPVVGETGREPADIEMELGGAGGWSVNEQSIRLQRQRPLMLTRSCC